MERHRFPTAALSVGCVLLYGWSIGLANTDRAIEYVYYTDKHTWNEARNVCHSIGGDLAKIDSQQTIDDIKKLAFDGYPGEDLLSGDFWIGLYDTPAERREWAVDCSELTFTSNYVEAYHSTELCFKMRGGSGWEGYSKPCSEDTPFLCEIHPGETCSFRYEMRNIDAYSVNNVNDYGVCETYCAYDDTCSGALFVSPSVCYKLPYNTSTAVSGSVHATLSSKFCLSFRKNETIVDAWANSLKYPVGVCDTLSVNNESVSRVSRSSTLVYASSSVDQTSSMHTVQTCLALVMTELMTVVQMSTVEITQQCSTQTHISSVTVQITATPSCFSFVTPSVTTQPSPNITLDEAEQMAEELSRNLTVDVKKTSAYRRSLISVPDYRQTSQAIGTVGIVCILVPLLLILSSDIKETAMCVKRLLTISRYFKSSALMSYSVEQISRQNEVSAPTRTSSEL